MGITIDEQIDGLRKAAVICTSVFAYDCQGYIKEAIDTLCKYQQMQADYETRLKADMVAMLTEIQLELDEMKITKVRSAGFAPYSKDPFRRGVNCSKDIIQQKIDKLKEQTGENT